MDNEKLLNVELLKEVFSEIECLEDATNSEFLKDVVNLEKQLLSISKKSVKKKSSVQELTSFKSSEENESVIHEGLTDSSDDEDNKYFEKSNYNECGRTLKNLIKQKTNLKHDYLKSASKEDSWTKSKLLDENLKSELAKLSGHASSKNTLLLDPILGMNIINPLFSSSALKEKLIGRISISTSKIRQFLDTQASKVSDWVTGGAIVSKFAKTSQKGNQYCVWHITDLSGDIKTVCVFLFGSAYKEYWKTSLGTVIGILNPVVMENKDRSEATLRVDNAQKILVMGTSKDYGLCKSKKKNGENCLSVVNKSKCDYCVYHMKREYNKACRRPDLQPPKIGRSLDNLRAKVLGKSQVFYNGKTFTGVIGKKSTQQMRKDEERMKLLSQSPVSGISEPHKQRNEDILKRLSQNDQSIPAKDIGTPSLSKPEAQMIDLGFTISKKERSVAKANALKYIREQGPLKRLVDNDRSKRTPEQIASVKRKLQLEEENKNKKVKMQKDTPTNPLEEKYLKYGITKTFLELMNSETRNSDLLKMAESQEREKYFDRLEVREKIENKMASTFKVECKAVKCLKCNYKAFSSSDFCKREKHPLKVINAIKRFWKCGNCSARTVSLELIPLHSCKNCGSSKWEKTSMMPERKNSNIINVPFSLRGDEEKFLGTATKQANLNLLVPEKAS